MKLAICGSRDINESKLVIEGAITMHQLFNIKEVVSGGAKGIDTAAKEFAINDKWEDDPLFCYELKYKEFPADWDLHGKAAGPIRNKQIAEYSDALLLIWDGKSKGSANMKKEMLVLNKPVYEIIINKYNC